MKVSNQEKSRIGIEYAKELLDKVSILSKDKRRPMTYYAQKINQLRGDLKITKTKKASREYLYKLAIHKKDLVN